MPHLISKLLMAEEPLFSLAIKELEEVSGRAGMDVRLISEIIEKTHKKIRELGLDANDTTGRELYHALLNRIREHDVNLVKQMGGERPDDVAEILPLIKTVVDGLDVPKRAWVLKKSIAKKLLQESPPLSVMRQLKYSSVDSMIKRENIAEIYGALRFAETPAWLKRFNTLYKQLKPSDFESRDIEILMIDKRRWGTLADAFVRKKRHNITHLKELGVILMLPTSIARLPGIAITALPLLLHYLNEIRLYSSFFKLQQVRPDFGKVVAETINADIRSAAVMAGQNIHWRVIQRYYGKLENEHHPEIFEPHVQPEDLHWRKAEEYLYKIDPELAFWKELDYVGVLAGDSPVSFNLMDVSIAYSTGAVYEQRPLFHMRESLWNELFMRYMGRKILEEQILNQLDNNMIKPEKIKV